jgi:transposase
MNIDAKRINSLAKYRLGWKVSDICRSECISRMTFYRWLRMYTEKGQEGLIKQSTRPKTIHRKITDDVIQKIVDLRTKTGANEFAIQSRLNAQNITVSHACIYKILKSRNLISSLKKPRKQRKYIRYERDHPNSMWQTDLTHWKEKTVIAYIDDYSRFITGFGIFDNGFAKYVILVFKRAMKAHGKPREVLTDHGTQFYSVLGGESEFDKFCQNEGIKHIMSGIGKPTTTGKIERWFGSFKKQIENFSSIDDYVKYYNFERPHKSLDYRTPSERFFEKV